MHAGAVAHIRIDALRRNLQAVRGRAGRAGVCAVVKADAYGHGLRHILPHLKDGAISRLAVAQLDEALELRRLGWTGAILCFGAPLAAATERERRERAAEAVAADIICTLTSELDAQHLAAEAGRLGRRASVEIKVDTGMGRLGFLPEEAFHFATTIAASASLELTGVYTHLATADEADLGFAHEQLRDFSNLMDRLRSANVGVPSFHAANSAALFRLPESRLDLVRPGLALYGYWSGPPAERPADLEPVMRITSPLVAVRRLPRGHGVGYGRAFTAARDSLVGVVPVGYADGYRRRLSGVAVVTLEAARDQPARTLPVIGRVSMDLISVDLTDAPHARVGDRVVLVSDDPAAENSVESLARTLDTIPYEITCLVGRRVRRVAV